MRAHAWRDAALRCAPGLICLLAGLIFALNVLGTRPLNPFNTSWIAGDPATNQLGFDYMRRESLFVLPLTWSHELGYPFGAATADLDDIPLLAMLFKLLNFALPAHFQYLGIFFALCASLQLYFGRRLAQLATHSAVLGWIGGLFFLVAPPFTWRALGHFALCAQWLILAALCELVPAENRPPSPRRYWRLPVLCAIAGAIHPYITLMTCGVCAAVLVRPLVSRAANIGVSALLAVAAACVLAAMASMLLFGFLSIGNGSATAASGYGYFTMDPMAPLDPEIFRSVLLRARTIQPDQYEGYNYLGVGVIAMGLVALARRFGSDFRFAPHVPVRLLLGIVLVTAVLAISTRVVAGGKVVFDIPLPRHMVDALSTFRSSGRLFWPGYYALYVLALAGVRTRHAGAIALLLAALLIQVMDTASLRKAIRRQWNGSTPVALLHDPVWERIPRNEAHLSLVPSMACGWGMAPGGPDGEQVFSRYAVSHGLTLDSFHSARDNPRWIDYVCGAPARLAQSGLGRDTAYVFTPSGLPLLLSLARAGRLNGKYCTSTDGFILCSAAWGKTGLDSSLADRFMQPLHSGVVALSASGPAGRIVLGGFADPQDTAAYTQTHRSTLGFRLAGPVGPSVHVTLTAAPALGGAAARQRIDISAGGMALLHDVVTPTNRTMIFDIPSSAITADNVVVLTLDLPDALSPYAAGINSDGRLFAIGLFDMNLQIE